MTSKQRALTLKYLVVGDSGVGKTSLLVRYCDDIFQNDYLSTIGVDFKIKRIQHNGQQVTLNIWDTAGQQRFRNITKSFYKGAHGIIVAYSISDYTSFEHIEKWIEQIKQIGNEKVSIILVATKSDLGSERKIKKQAGQELANQYGLDFIEISAKENKNIDNIFQMLTETVLSKTNNNNITNSPNEEQINVAINVNKKQKKNDNVSNCC